MKSIKSNKYRKVFAAFVLGLSVLFLPFQAHAETLNSPTPVNIVNYELPYPGILPGSPLYLFKNLRDKIEEIITTDNTKKSEFYLLQADKQLSAALLMHEKGDGEVADEMFSKSQENLENSIDCLIKSKNSNENMNNIPDRLKTSSIKQRQEILNLLKNPKRKDDDYLKIKLDQAKQIENRANSLNP